MGINGMQHPMARPNFLCRPYLVSGMPIFLEILLLTPEMPSGRFQENEKPNFLAIEAPLISDLKYFTVPDDTANNWAILPGLNAYYSGSVWRRSRNRS